MAFQAEHSPSSAVMGVGCAVGSERGWAEGLRWKSQGW